MLYRPLQALQSLTRFQDLAAGRSAAHRHPGRHRAERAAQADRDHRRPAAAGRQMEGVLQAARPTTPSTCSDGDVVEAIGRHRRRRHRPRHAAQPRSGTHDTTHPGIVPVVIVGAGPTGITAATLLAQYGVDCLVLDRWAGVYPQPRAVHLDDEIYRILAGSGIADEFAAISRPALGLQLLDRTHRVLAEFHRDTAPQRATATRRPTCSTNRSWRRCCGRT